MTLLEAHSLIVTAAALGITELITEAVENHKAEMILRGRKVIQDYRWAYGS
jgi:phosphopantetheine adenylyltransferase